MSTRVAFFQIKRLGDEGLKALLDGIRSEPFRGKRTSGFLLDRCGTSQIEARFVRKLTEARNVIDPLGRTYRFETVTIDEQRFTLRLSKPNLILFNPTGCLKALIGRLCDFSNFTIAVEGVDWQPEKLLRLFSQSFSEVRVSYVGLREIELSASTSAKLSFSGTGDVIAEMRRFLKAKTHTFDALKFEFDFAGNVRRCELRSDGAIQLYGDPDPSILFRVLQIADQFATARPD